MFQRHAIFAPKYLQTVRKLWSSLSAGVRISLISVLTLPTAHAQSLTSYDLRTNFDAAFPSGSTSQLIEDFNSVTSRSFVSQGTPDTWSGFTLLATGTSPFGSSEYCNDLRICMNWTTAPPTAPGIYGAFGDGILEFIPTGNVIGFGLDYYDWNDGGQRSQIFVTLSDASTFTITGPTTVAGDPGGFIGFKLDDTSVYAGITISEVEWQRVGFDSEIVGFKNVTTVSALPDLQSQKTKTVWDPNSDGLYATPGNEMFYTINISNEGLADVDAGSLFLVDTLPSEVSFWNGDIDAGGPETFATISSIGFQQQNGAALTFDPALNFGVSFAASKPTDFSQCSALSLDNTYRTDIRHLCINLGGNLGASAAAPEFSISYRTRIE